MVNKRPREVNEEILRKAEYDLVNDWDGDYVWDNSIKAYRPPKYPGEKGDEYMEIDHRTLFQKCKDNIVKFCGLSKKQVDSCMRSRKDK